VSTADFIGIAPTDDPLSWRLPITKVMTTARGALYGGAGLAAVIAALEVTTGRPLVWATAQYLSFVRMPATLDIRLDTPVVGARTTQARGTVRHGDQEILSVLATLGHRDEHAHWTYAEPPDVPAPDDTRRQVVAEAEGTIHEVLDMRIVRGVSRRQLLRGKPPVETGGRAAYWVRVPGGRHVPDAAELALIGDLVPSAFPSATGLPISGSSLDNTIRTGELVETEWVLADVHVHSVVDGYGHGIAHLWSQDGTLLGTASQSAFVRRPDA
jgi:acyl-CoA thioesterase-2